MNSRLHSTVSLGILCAGVILGTSCSRPSSGLLPAAPGALTGGQSTTGSTEGEVFPLLGGSFTIEARGGDGIVGTYAGTSTFSGAGRQRSSVTLQVTGGSGTFAGASGSLAVSGTGAFADEGKFTLDGEGELTLAGGRRAVVVFTLRGSSVASCSPSEQIAIAQSATGTMSRAGRVDARLSHVVGNTGCSS
jgi:hypothetical protein